MASCGARLAHPRPPRAWSGRCGEPTWLAARSAGADDAVRPYLIARVAGPHLPCIGCAESYLHTACPDHWVVHRGGNRGPRHLGRNLQRHRGDADLYLSRAQAHGASPITLREQLETPGAASSVSCRRHNEGLRQRQAAAGGRLGPAMRQCRTRAQGHGPGRRVAVCATKVFQ